jgi:hypothetical protein
MFAGEIKMGSARRDPKEMNAQKKAFFDTTFFFPWSMESLSNA